jgi:hypothetical protein
MKSTLKLILVSMVLSIGILSAQTYRLEVGFVSPKQSGAEFSTNYFNGGRLGVTAEFGLKHNFSLLTGALYSLVYSNKVQYYSSTDSVTYKTFGHSIDIPLRLTYTLPLSKNLKVFGFAGPNINVGIAQPRKTTAVLSSSLREVIDEFGNVPTNGTEDLYKNAMISRINFQMGAGGGVQWKNYQLKGGYDFGINSINKVDTSKLLRQGGWYVSLVYQF